MTQQDLDELLRLYEETQVCGPDEQPDRDQVFMDAIRKTAAQAPGLSNAETKITAHVTRLYLQRCRMQTRRLGLPPPSHS